MCIFLFTSSNAVLPQLITFVINESVTRFNGSMFVFYYPYLFDSVQEFWDGSSRVVYYKAEYAKMSVVIKLNRVDRVYRPPVCTNSFSLRKFS